MLKLLRYFSSTLHHSYTIFLAVSANPFGSESVLKVNLALNFKSFVSKYVRSAYALFLYCSTLYILQLETQNLHNYRAGMPSFWAEQIILLWHTTRVFLVAPSIGCPRKRVGVIVQPGC